jgi:hypothetical protein
LVAAAGRAGVGKPQITQICADSRPRAETDTSKYQTQRRPLSLSFGFSLKICGNLRNLRFLSIWLRGRRLLWARKGLFAIAGFLCGERRLSVVSGRGQNPSTVADFLQPSDGATPVRAQRWHPAVAGLFRSRFSVICLRGGGHPGSPDGTRGTDRADQGPAGVRAGRQAGLGGAGSGRGRAAR